MVRARRLTQPCEGSALLLTLLVVALLTAGGMALATLIDVERLSAANLRHELEVAYAADAAIEEAVGELSSMTDWTAALNGGVRSPLYDSTSPTTAWGATLDLLRLTRDLQARTDAARPGTAITTKWQVYLTGELSELLPAGTVTTDSFVAVWVGDDLAETDGNPVVDSNGVIAVRAIGVGPRDARAEREVMLLRPVDPTQPVRLTAWRDVR